MRALIENRPENFCQKNSAPFCAAPTAGRQVSGNELFFCKGSLSFIQDFVIYNLS
jgi:hypothetical protein